MLAQLPLQVAEDQQLALEFVTLLLRAHHRAAGEAGNRNILEGIMKIVVEPVGGRIRIIRQNPDNLVAVLALVLHNLHEQRKIAYRSGQYANLCAGRAVVFSHSADFGVFNVIHLSSSLLANFPLP